MQLNHSLLASLLALLMVTVVGLSARQGNPDAQLLARARAIHARVLTIDTHVDISGANYATPALDPGSLTTLKCDLVKMKAGGLDGVFLAVFVGQRPDLTPAGFKAAYGQAVAKFDAIDRLTRMHPELCELARTPADVERIVKTGKRAIMIGVENGYPAGTDPATLREFYARGARYMTLVHTTHNQFADSSGPKEPLYNGLSEQGKKVVAEMNRLGMMVDLSHASAKSFWDAIALSKAPIIESHSGCAAVSPSDRNLTDDQLKALAKNGGVIQIVALSDYLKAPSPERAKAIQALRDELELGGQPRGGRGQGGRAAQGGTRPAMTPEQQAAQEKLYATYEERMKAIDAKYPGATLKDFVDHIDHAVKVAGVDHVGIGTDFDGGGGIPGFNDHSEALNVTVELVRRGYSEDQIAKIWGGNLLRVWREVEKAKK
jgi:membrane dipeptidase